MTAPDHVLITTDTVGGVWTYSIELARELCRHGTHVTLAALGPLPSTAQCAEAESLPSLDLHCFDGKLEWMDEPWNDVDRSCEWLLDLEAAARPDILHLNMYSHAAKRFHAPMILVAHSCVLSWWRAVKGEEAPERYREYAMRVRACFEGASVVVAVSPWMAEEVRNLYGLQRPPAVICNGRTLPEHAPTTKNAVAFSCGRLWDEGKNIGVLDAAAALTSVPVYVAGDGAKADFRAARALGRLTGEQVRKWLLSSAVYAHPALYEPFGLAVLEAALCGCALVLADIPSLRELWPDAALFVNPRDPRAWADAIELLQDSEPLRVDLARKARDVAVHRTAARMGEEYMNVYARARAGKAAV